MEFEMRDGGTEPFDIDAIDLVQLPQYSDYEVVDMRIIDDKQIAIQVARSVDNPSLRVICKSAASDYDDTEGFLAHEYKVLKRIHATIDAMPERSEVPRAFLRRKSVVRPSTSSFPGSGEGSSNSLASANLSLSRESNEHNLGTFSRHTSRSHLQQRIPKPLSYELVEGYEILVCEHFDGISLRQLITQHVAGPPDSVCRLPLEDVLAIALQTTEGLEVVHRARISHKDINPSTILVRRADNTEGYVCQLVNFCISEAFESQLENASMNQLQGTPAYLSPEQTGRIDKTVDWRTDIYSLGVTIWEMIVGRPPFESNDLAEIIYSHMAKETADPRTFRPMLPQLLVDLVNKLMKKNASERYQTATSLRFDLLDMQNYVNAYKISIGMPMQDRLSDEAFCSALEDTDIVIGSRDFSRKLCFTDKLYGREKELKTLLDAHQRVASGDSANEFMCIVGASGSGKSALVHELEAELSSSGSQLIITKSSSNHNIPFAGIISIMDQLVKILLSESNEVLKNWERKLARFLGRDALSLLAKLVPSIKNIVGDIGGQSVDDLHGRASIQHNQESRQALSQSSLPHQAQENMETKLETFRAIESFLGLFASQERPLAVYLDNILVVPGTVGLLKYIFQRKRISHLFVIGSLAPPEGLTTHEALEKLQQDLAMPFETLELGPVSIDAIRSFLQDTIRPPIGDITELAVLFFRKTQGNPLHIKEFIKYCEMDGLVRFDDNLCGWTWDIKELDRKTELTDNVVGLLITEFQKLPQDTQQLLKEAACIGAQFDTRTLCYLYTPHQVSALMSPGLHDGFVLAVNPRRRTLTGSIGNAFHMAAGAGARRASRKLSNTLSPSYKFCHARLHSAIYDAIAVQEKQKIHLAIARQLKECTSSEELQDRLFEVVHHFNEARHLISDIEERLLLIQLNQLAASRAMSTNDPELLLRHLRIGEEQIHEIGVDQMWKDSHDIVFETMRLLALALIRQGSYDDAQSILAELKVRANPNERLLVLHGFVTMHHALSNFNNVLESSLGMLHELGVTVPSDNTELDRAAAYEFGRLCGEIQTAIDSATQWGFDAEMSGDLKVVDALLFYSEYAARALNKTSLAQYIGSIGCLRSIRYGLGEHTAEHFATILRYLCGARGYFNAAQFLWLADVVESLKLRLTPEQQATTMVSAIYGFSYVWGASETTNQLVNMIDAALSAGLCDVGSFLSLQLCFCLPSTGMSKTAIGDLWSKLQKNAHASRCEMYRQVEFLFSQLLHFATAASIPTSAYQPQILRAKHLSSYIQFLDACIFERETQNSLVADMDEIRETFSGLQLYVDIALAQVVVYASQCMHQPQDRDATLAKIANLVSMIERIVGLNPVKNSQCKLWLALAEQARAQDEVSRAVKMYEDAIETAHASGVLFVEAWATELNGVFWLEQASKRLARSCITSAIQLWLQWGAGAKADHLETKHAVLLAQSTPGVMRQTSRRVKAPTLIVRSPTSDDAVDDVRDGPLPTPLRTTHDEMPVSPLPMKQGGMQTIFFGNRKPVDVDLTTVLKVTTSLSNEKSLAELLDKMLDHLSANTGATKIALLLSEADTLWVRGVSELDQDGNRKQCTDSFELRSRPDVAPVSIVNHVFHTQQSIVFYDTPEDEAYCNDVYIATRRPKSILCCAIKHQSNRTGLVYLENAAHQGVFTASRTEFVHSLMGAASIAIENARLTKKNQELSEALRETEQSKKLAPGGGRPKYNFDAPIKRVLDAVAAIKTRFDSNDDDIKKLDDILAVLTSDGLFSANIDNANDENGQELDQDTKSFIESSLLQRSSKSNVPTLTLMSASELALNLSTSSYTTNGSSVTSLSASSTKSPFAASQVTPTTFASAPATPREMRLTANQTEIDAYLECSLTEEFDVFKLADICHGAPLYHLTMYFLRKFDLLGTIGIHDSIARTFMQRIEAAYHDLPYHSSTHAADVLQTAGMLIMNTDMREKFSGIEIFSLCVGSAVHDVDHPGVNNAFLVQTGHPIAILYNDMAVLESHHASKAFEIVRSPDANIFGNLAVDQMRFCRKLIISIVLATDLSQHFQFINKFKGKIATSSLKLEEEPDRQLVLEMAVKCGDLGNPTKRFDESKRWSFLVMEEFFRQGDREKQLGLPVSKFMDRNDTNIPKW
ncbi:hypothetical protein BC831DRAFT_460202 [Entophlyctis helioformis]|nr:hypothetical protein BC831DRAFT_460202 [Entophlyctis helioformis]